MEPKTLEHKVVSLQPRLSPAFVEGQVRELLRQGEDIGGGINAFRLTRHLLGDPRASDEQVTWAYERLKPALGAALERHGAHPHPPVPLPGCARLPHPS